MIKVHHLNCSMPAQTILDLSSVKRHLCCHCLLLEANSGLALVDTGVSKDHSQRFIKTYFSSKTQEPSRTVTSEILKAGFDPKDVRNVFITHIDHDHVGGLIDFPWANVYIHVNEIEFSKQIQSSAKLKLRFKPSDWRASQIYCLGDEGDRWNGFDSVKVPKEFSDEIMMIPLFGHTPGHCGFAINSTDGWLFHAGDAFYSKQDLQPSFADRSVWSEALAAFLSVDQEKRIWNLERLRTLTANNPKVRVINSHDPIYIEEFGE